MSLIVEDGSQVPNSESYVSLAEVDAYWAARNDLTWADSWEINRESAIRQATAYLDANWIWLGDQVSYSQSRAFPRYFPGGIDKNRRLVGITDIPKDLKSASCELAKEALLSTLAPTLDRGGMVKSETIGPLSVTYLDGAPGTKKFQFVELLLRPFVQGGGDSITSMSRLT